MKICSHLTPDAKDDDYIVIYDRGLMRYFDREGREFIVDSEMIINDDYSISIMGVKTLESKQLPQAVQNKILKRVMHLCRKGGIRARLDI